MSDLQHEDAKPTLRGGSQEREDPEEDGAASGFVSPSRPAEAALATERVAAADSSRTRRREAAHGASSAPPLARSRSSTNLAGAFALWGWSRRPAAASAARPRLAPAWSPGVRGPARCVRGKGHLSTACRRRRRSAGHCRHD